MGGREGLARQNNNALRSFDEAVKNSMSLFAFFLGPEGKDLCPYCIFLLVKETSTVDHLVSLKGPVEGLDLYNF